MKRREEEHLYRWYLEHREKEFTNAKQNWLKILKNNFHGGQNSDLNDDLQEDELIANEKKIKTDFSNELDNNDSCKDEPLEINKTTDSFFEKIICAEDEQSPESSLKSIQKSLKTPFIFMNKTNEIAMSLGAEQDQSSISRISAMLTPATTCNAYHGAKDDSHETFVLNVKDSHHKQPEGYIITEHKINASVKSPERKLIKPLNFDVDSPVEFQTQAFRTDDLHRSSEFIDNLPTPEHRFNILKNLPVNCTSTPVSDFKLSKNVCEKGNLDKVLVCNKDINFGDYDNNSKCNVYEPFNTPKVNRGKVRNMVSRNILTSFEKNDSSSSFSSKNEANKSTKLSLSYLRNKKKFIYPTLEEKVSEDLAIYKKTLTESLTEPVFDHIKEDSKCEKTNIVKQSNFMTACVLTTNLNEQDKYINKMEEKQYGENYSTFRQQFCQENEVDKSLILSKNHFKEDETSISKYETGYDKITSGNQYCEGFLDMKIKSKCSKVDQFLEEVVEFERGSNETVDLEKKEAPFPGFSTANMPLITESNVKSNDSLNIGLLGFQSALGKKIGVTNEALKKAKSLWNDVEEENLYISSEGASHKISESLSWVPDFKACKQINAGSQKLAFAGFQSALGKNIVVSTEALQKAKSLWNDVEEENLGFDSEKNYQHKGTESSNAFKATEQANKINNSLDLGFPGFQSGLGKKIVVTNEALKKAKSLWNDVEEENLYISSEGASHKISESLSGVPDFKACKQTNAVSQKLAFAGFQSASLWNDVEEENLGFDSEKNYQHKGTESSNVFKATEQANKINNSLDLGFPGFQSALGKKIEVGTEALEKANSLWNDVEDEKSLRSSGHMKAESLNVVSTLKANEQTNAISQKTGFKGFKSGLGSKISTCSKSLLKAKALFIDDCPEDNLCLENERKIPIEPIIGFKTANNKNVAINPSSLIKAKLIFEEIESNEEMTSMETEKEKSNYFQKIEGNISPILGSQKNRSRNSQKRCLSEEDINTNARKVLKEEKDLKTKNPNLSTTGDITQEDFDTQENQEINEITEAFLLDSSWDDASLNLEENNDVSTVQFNPTLNIDYERETLRKKQEEIIKLKMENKLLSSNQSEGSLFQFKLQHKKKRVKLCSLMLVKTFLEDNLAAVSITSRNCNEFRFAVDNDGSVKLEFDDGVEVIPGKDNLIGWREIESGFLSSKGINCSLVPSSWVLNHYSLIVWKLASLQRRLGHNFQKSVFSLEEVLKQLRLRYDVEILGGRRSILRKVFEQDDTPRRTMVLCVSNISINEEGNKLVQKDEKQVYNSSPLTLTDGWYNIECQVDNAMLCLLQKQVIKVATKLVLHGTEFVGNPTPCHPLQSKSETVQLKIHTNMCRLAAWHSRLGVKPNAGYLPSTTLTCVLENGGPVGTIEVILCRKYPLAFMEKMEDKMNIVSARVSEVRSRASALKRDAMMEEIYYQVEKEIEEEENRVQRNKNSSFNVNSVKNLSDGRKLAEYLKDSNDPSIMQTLSDEQLRLLAKCKEEELNRRRQKLAKEVNLRTKNIKSFYEAVPLLKLGVVDKNEIEAVITIWRPQEELLSLQEGGTYSFHYLTSTTTRNNIKQLTWNKQSFIRPSKTYLTTSKLHQNLLSNYSKFSLSILDDVPFREIDVIGIVIKIFDVVDGGQIVCLCDQESNFIYLRFSPSVNDLSFQEVVTLGQVIFVTNCSLRGQKFGDIVAVNVSPFTVISSGIQKSFESIMNNLKKLKEDPFFVTNAEQKLQDYLDDKESRKLDCKNDYSGNKKGENSPESPDKRKSNSPELNRGYPSRLKALHISSAALSKPFRTPVRSSKKESS